MHHDSDEFPQAPGLCYLNHAAVSPWPERSRRAVAEFCRANVHYGARDYPSWLATEQRLRHALARLINAPAIEDIALLKNTSEGLSVVAHGLPWKAGDNVVLYADEFPSNRIVWESLTRYGVEVRQVPLVQEAKSEALLLAHCDARTRLLSVSSVQYHNGWRSDLTRLGAWCRDHGVLFCVDAIQSLGALAFDVQAIGADVVVADGHKWLLGPEGLALFYCREELRAQLTLYQYGWHMVADPGDYLRRDWQLAESGQRFECGSTNLLAAHALEASLGLLLEIGLEEVERRVVANRRALVEQLTRLEEIELLSSTEPFRESGIVTLRPRHGDPLALHRYLMERQVICAPRGGGVRLSPHFYTPPWVLEQAVEEIRQWLRRP